VRPASGRRCAPSASSPITSTRSSSPPLTGYWLSRFGSPPAGSEDVGEAAGGCTPRGSGRINWISVSTVLSAAILIAAEVFGAAFAGGWAFGNLFNLGEYGTYILQVLFFVLGIAVMVAFIRAAMRVEPFVTRN